MFEFLMQPSCTHEKITPNIFAGYCPDCGEYVENHWYITRCKCCGNKHKSIILRGKISKLDRFCKNCGCSDFEVEEIEKIDIVNINYAVVMKKTFKTPRKNVFQTWVENEIFSPKLLTSCVST